MTMVSEDLENLLKLFDFALSSDNPAVKKALKNLLLVVSIVEPQEDASKPGPLAEIKMELQILRAEIATLKNSANLRGGTYNHPPAFPSYPAYPYQPNTSGNIPWITNGKPWTASSTTGTTGATGSSTTYNGLTYTKMMEYVGSMIDDDDDRFNKKDIT